MALNSYERNAQAIAAAISFGRSTVQTEFLAKEHDICVRCDGSGIQPGTDDMGWPHVCDRCGGRGVTLYAKEKMSI